MESIRTYLPSDREIVEAFRLQTFAEGNNSLSVNKFKPDEFDGQIFLFFIDNELASISAVEYSNSYTTDSNVGRICRYHILKKFRHCNAGFKMLPFQVKWAEEKGIKLLYWTHDVNNRALNAMYQHKKMMPNKKEFFRDPLYQSFQWIPELRFIAGDCVQYVYAKKLDEAFNWEPQGQMTRIPS